MSSPITLSGFNNIDFNAILEAVMVQERLPVSRLETQKRALEQQNTQLGQLAGLLTTLKSAADDLADPTSLSVLTASSSNAKLLGVSGPRASRADDLLERDDVGVDVRQHPGDTFRPLAPVHADGAVDVVGDDA
jgi:flagellar capping protein FliD